MIGPQYNNCTGGVYPIPRSPEEFLFLLQDFDSGLRVMPPPSPSSLPSLPSLPSFPPSSFQELFHTCYMFERKIIHQSRPRALCMAPVLAILNDHVSEGHRPLTWDNLRLLPTEVPYIFCGWNVALLPIWSWALFWGVMFQEDISKVHIWGRI